LAGKHTIAHLYLETERLDGGLYERLGWRTIRQLRKDDVEFLVMLKSLVDSSTDGAA
jgi:hypothetical protein